MNASPEQPKSKSRVSVVSTCTPLLIPIGSPDSGSSRICGRSRRQFMEVPFGKEIVAL